MRPNNDCRICQLSDELRLKAEELAQTYINNRDAGISQPLSLRAIGKQLTDSKDTNEHLTLGKSAITHTTNKNNEHIIGLYPEDMELPEQRAFIASKNPLGIFTPSSEYIKSATDLLGENNNGNLPGNRHLWGSSDSDAHEVTKRIYYEFLFGTLSEMQAYRQGLTNYPEKQMKHFMLTQNTPIGKYIASQEVYNKNKLCAKDEMYETFYQFYIDMVNYGKDEPMILIERWEHLKNRISKKQEENDIMFDCIEWESKALKEIMKESDKQEQASTEERVKFIEINLTVVRLSAQIYLASLMKRFIYNETDKMLKVIENQFNVDIELRYLSVNKKDADNYQSGYIERFKQFTTDEDRDALIAMSFIKHCEKQAFICDSPSCFIVDGYNLEKCKESKKSDKCYCFDYTKENNDYCNTLPIEAKRQLNQLAFIHESIPKIETFINKRNYMFNGDGFLQAITPIYKHVSQMNAQ